MSLPERCCIVFLDVCLLTVNSIQIHVPAFLSFTAWLIFALILPEGLPYINLLEWHVSLLTAGFRWLFGLS